MQTGRPLLDPAAADEGDSGMRGRHDHEPGKNPQQRLEDLSNPAENVFHVPSPIATRGRRPRVPQLTLQDSDARWLLKQHPDGMCDTDASRHDDDVCMAAARERKDRQGARETCAIPLPGCDRVRPFLLRRGKRLPALACPRRI